jgi:hypothetical protein
MKLARAAISIALLLSAMTAATLLLIDPPGGCNDWRHRHGSSSIWEMLAFWTAPILALHCFIVARWDWFLRKAAEKSDLAVPAEYV